MGLAIARLCKKLSGGGSRLMNAEVADYYSGDVDVGRLFVYVCMR